MSDATTRLARLLKLQAELTRLAEYRLARTVAASAEVAAERARLLEALEEARIVHADLTLALAAGRLGRLEQRRTRLADEAVRRSAEAERQSLRKRFVADRLAEAEYVEADAAERRRLADLPLPPDDDSAA